MSIARALGALTLLSSAWVSPAAALDCGERDQFLCLQDHANAELKRLGVTPTPDQKKSFDALPAFSVYLDKGPEAAAAHWEENELPIYDLILTLLLAGKDKHAETVALAATKPYGAYNADNEQVTGKAGFKQMKQDLKSYYHGEEDWAYALGCVSDEAFKDQIGGGPAMRKGACRVPYDRRSIQRAFGMMQLLKGVTGSHAIEATMRYAYRVPSCTVATAVLEVVPTIAAIDATEESAGWNVLDMTTICSAEFLIGLRL